MNRALETVREPERCEECRSDNIYKTTGVYYADPSLLPPMLKKCAECGHTWEVDE